MTLEAITTRNRLQEKQRKKAQESEAKKAKDPHYYEGNDEVLKFRAELKKFQFLTGMTDAQVEIEVSKFKDKRESAEGATDGV